MCQVSTCWVVGVVRRVVDAFWHVYSWLEGVGVVWIGRHTSYGRGLSVSVVVGIHFVKIHRISMCWLVGGVNVLWTQLGASTISGGVVYVIQRRSGMGGGR